MKRLLLMISTGLLCNSAAANATTNTLDGKAIFTKNCSACHSITPPPKLAPPITPLASRYHMQFQKKEDGIKRIMAFVKLPDKKNAIDPQAIARFGLMAPVVLPDNELRAVAEWVWDQYNPNMGRGIGGQGMGRGMGPGRMNP